MGGKKSSSSSSSRPPLPDLSLLDALACEAAAVAVEVPYYAVAVARARLDRARRRLLSRLAAAGGKEAGAAAGGRDGAEASAPSLPLLLPSPWPEPRDAALISLFCGALFPLVDASEPGSGLGPSAGHPASGPAALLAAAPLALCPVAERRDVGSGLLLATALQRACEGVVVGGGGSASAASTSSSSSSSCSSASGGAAWAPEIVDFAAEVVRRAVAASEGGGGGGGEATEGGAGRWRLPAGGWDVFVFFAADVAKDGRKKQKKERKEEKEKKQKEEEEEEEEKLDLSLDPARVLSRDASYSDPGGNASSSSSSSGDDSSSAALLYPARCTFAALALLERVAEGQKGSPAAPEALADAIAAVELFLAKSPSSSSSSSSSPSPSPLRSALRGAASSALEALRSAAEETLRTRSPLFRGRRGGGGAAAAAAGGGASASKPPHSAAAASAGGIQTLNPRFDEDFAPGRDADPDRERAAQRALKRSISRERRGAMRELRKDAAFVAAARESDAKAVSAERKAERRAGLLFMEQQAADARSGGQGGQWKRRKFK